MCNCGRYIQVFVIVSKLVMIDLHLYSLKKNIEESHHRRRYGVIPVYEIQIRFLPFSAFSITGTI